MNRAKRLYILLGVLVAASVITFAVSRFEERKEEIRNSDEVVLEIPSDSVESLSWEYDSNSFSFHKDENWIYDSDEAFPVDAETINEFLSPFEEFGVSFIIENAEDLSQYSLDNPVCTINIGTADETYTIELGDFSTMDSERYVSIGDGNVYLVTNDPLDYYDAELSELIDHDDVPQFDTVSHIAFTGKDEYEVTYEEDGADTYREDDVYFTEIDGEHLPLDTGNVDGYLDDISGLGLTDYVTYNATDDDLASYGLDSPELTVSVDYTSEDEDGNETSGTFVLNVSRDPDELAQQTEETEAAETDSETEEEEMITAYARVGESKIVYQITGDEYKSLMASSYDDLRHAEVVPAAFDDISGISISLEGVDYTIDVAEKNDEKTYSYGEEELDITDFQSAMEALEAESFTSEEPTRKEEISLTLTLGLEGDPTVTIELYRYDGDSCLAVVDGDPVSLVSRSEVVDLIEAVNAIVLN